MSANQRMLDAARQRLEFFETTHFGGGDPHGEINIPFHKRGEIDQQLQTYRELKNRVAHWENRVQAERLRVSEPVRAANKAAREAAVDLRVEHEGKTEVLWLISGDWHPVQRWNRKSVSVLLAGSLERIPHNQVLRSR